MNLTGKMEPCDTFFGVCLRRFRAGPPRVAIILTAIWLIGCVWYVSNNIGWAALWTFLPHELGGFCAGVFAPPAFVWILVAYIRRSADFTETAGHIRQGMSRLTCADEESSDRVEAISEALTKQAAALTAATDRAAEQAQQCATF